MLRSGSWLRMSFLVLCSLAAFTPVARAQDCTIRDLGPGRAWDINNRGEIVGFTDPGLPAFWATPTSTVALLATYPGALSTTVHAINDSGAMVGTAQLPGGTLKGVYWANATAVPVALPGQGSIQAIGLNNAGQIVGQSDVFGALWWRNPASWPLPLIDGSTAHDINEKGEIVGMNRGYTEGRFWSSPYAAPQPLAMLPDGARAEPTSLNDAGEIVGVGVVFDTPGSTRQKAIVWASPSATPTPVVDGRRTLGWANAINEPGEIAGWEIWLGAIYSPGPSSVGLPLGALSSADAPYSAAFGSNDAGLIVGVSGPRAALWGPIPAGSSGCQAAIAIDVRPADDTNVINQRSGGTVAVAILSSPIFDALAMVDPATVRLAGAAIAQRQNETRMMSTEDVNGDGLIDLVLHFAVAELDVRNDDTTIELTGFTFDGAYLQGRDSVRIR